MHYYKQHINDRAKSELYRAGIAAKMIGVPPRKLRYHCQKKHIDFTLVKEGNRTFFAFTDKQISDAIYYFNFRDRVI